MVDRIYPTELQLNKANSSDKEALFMPPTSNMLEGHIASVAFVRPFVTLFVCIAYFRTVHATVLKFLIWIRNEKIADTYFFIDRIISLS